MSESCEISSWRQVPLSLTPRFRIFFFQHDILGGNSNFLACIVSMVCTLRGGVQHLFGTSSSLLGQVMSLLSPDFCWEPGLLVAQVAGCSVDRLPCARLGSPSCQRSQLLPCYTQTVPLASWRTLGDTGVPQLLPSPQLFCRSSHPSQLQAAATTSHQRRGQPQSWFLASWHHVCSLTKVHSFPRSTVRQKLLFFSEW